MDTKKIKLLLLACLIPCQLWIGLYASAATLSILEIQAPAWLERGGKKIALTDDAVAQRNDRVQTGADGKASIRLQNNRKLSLGNNSTLAIHRDSIELLAGVMRLSPDKFTQKESSTQLKAITSIINTKNADLWSEATAGKTRVILISGSFEVNHNSGIIIISEALTAFEIHADNSTEIIPPHPINTLNLSELLEKTDLAKTDNPTHIAAPAANTDTQTKDKSKVESEKYIVYLYSSPNLKKANAMNEKFQAAGHPSQLFTAEKNNAPYYRIGVSNFESLASAKKFSARIEKSMKIKNTWIDIVK